MFFAHVVSATTRMPAGEIDRATIDFLFAQPVSRWTVYLGETIVWLTGGCVIVLFAVAGTALGNAFVTDGSGGNPAGLFFIIVNLYAVYAMIGSFSMLVSSLADRRGRAVGIVVGILMAQLLWNFIGQYWSVAENLSFLSFLHYFKPMPILGDGTIPYGHLAILGILTAGFWAAGATIFIRRDIRTV